MLLLKTDSVETTYTHIYLSIYLSIYIYTVSKPKEDRKVENLEICVKYHLYVNLWKHFSIFCRDGFTRNSYVYIYIYYICIYIYMYIYIYVYIYVFVDTYIVISRFEPPDTRIPMVWNRIFPMKIAILLLCPSPIFRQTHITSI